MAAAVAQPVRDEQVMDTRTPSPSNGQPVKDGNSDAQSDGISEDSDYKPDLSKEVSLLSTKLINAINYQTNLDDTLQATRHQLEQANQELKRVQAEKQSLDDAITQGVLVKKSEVEKTMAKLRADLILEKEKRESADRAKRQTDGELENLTASLFEEANNMVAEARKDTEAVEKRNSQLRGQLSDTEAILASQQEQLQDLKSTMESLERTQPSARDSSVPSTPITSNTATFDALHQHSPTADIADIQPDHPLHFSQLLQPMLRTDVSIYTDFYDLLSNARKAGAPHSRNASGTHASASQTNLASLASTSSPNLPGSFSFSANNSPSTSTFSNTTLNPPLKESKFYKRTLLEDLDPTLRLDLAPGLSFLSRRTFQSSLLNGTLVVEPFAPSSNWKFYSPVFACALCGESRKDPPYQRKYRFRTSESDDAQRYPLCDYCLGRIRAAGDFVGFMRMVRDGHWRCGNEEEEKSAWEEAVRLRERMFWARLGGGVVPRGALPGPLGTTGLGLGGDGNGRKSLESVPEQRSRSPTVEASENGVLVPEDQRTVGPVEDVPAKEDGTQEEEEERAPDFTKELRRRTMLRAGDEVPGLQEKLSEIAAQDSEQADEQLRREADCEEVQTPMSEPERFSTPEPEPASAAPTSPLKPDPAPLEAGNQPRASTTEGEPLSKSRSTSPSKERPSRSRPTSPSKEERPSSRASNSSQRELAPPPNERRPSSVLARVRAMEAGKK